MKIGIAGIGGIGSNVARHLAQAGAASIKIVDFDRVEASNLNRQFYRHSQIGQRKIDALENNLRDIFPGLVIEKVSRKIGCKDAEKIFADCSVVVEGFDEKSLKKMIVEELGREDRMIVSASGIAGRDLAGISIKKMGPCLIVGDLVSDEHMQPLFGPKVVMVAALMAGIVLNRIRDLKMDDKKISVTGADAGPAGGEYG